MKHLIFILLFILGSCVSQNENYSPKESQSYILSLTGKFKNNGIPYPGRVKALMKSKTNMKIEVTDPFGFVTIATLVVAGNEVTILNSLEKKYYQGTYDKQFISQVIGIDIDREDLFDLFYGKDFSTSNWECMLMKSKEFQKVCAHKQAPVRVTRIGTDPYKEFQVTHKKSQISLKLKSFEPTVSTDADYKVEIPKNYSPFSQNETASRL